jgi:ribosomal-protein-alanine N-acetyltransferase
MLKSLIIAKSFSKCAKIKKMPEPTYIIRPVRDEDIPQVIEIDHEAFPGEWTFRSFGSYRRDIRNPVARYIVACVPKEKGAPQQNRPKVSWLKRVFSPNYSPIQEALSEEYILGFVGSWIMTYEAHIIAIAVRSNYRRKGIGEGLLISIIESAVQSNAKVVTLEVRVSNKAAQALYKKYGFQVIGRRTRYYSDNGEDALLMSTDTITSAPFQARLQQLKEDHAKRWEGISYIYPG